MKNCISRKYLNPVQQTSVKLLFNFFRIFSLEFFKYFTSANKLKFSHNNNVKSLLTFCIPFSYLYIFMYFEKWVPSNCVMENFKLFLCYCPGFLWGKWTDLVEIAWIYAFKFGVKLRFLALHSQAWRLESILTPQGCLRLSLKMAMYLNYDFKCIENGKKVKNLSGKFQN